MAIHASTNVVHIKGAANGSVQPAIKVRKVAGAEQCAPEIIEHLPPADQRNRSAALVRCVSDDPWQQLPVTPGPAVLAHDGDLVMGGKLLEELDIGDESGPRKDPFKKVMT